MTITDLIENVNILFDANKLSCKAIQGRINDMNADPWIRITIDIQIGDTIYGLTSEQTSNVTKTINILRSL